MNNQSAGRFQFNLRELLLYVLLAGVGMFVVLPWVLGVWPDQGRHFTGPSCILGSCC